MPELQVDDCVQLPCVPPYTERGFSCIIHCIMCLPGRIALQTCIVIADFQREQRYAPQMLSLPALPYVALHLIVLF